MRRPTVADGIEGYELSPRNPILGVASLCQDQHTYDALANMPLAEVLNVLKTDQAEYKLRGGLLGQQDVVDVEGNVLLSFREPLGADLALLTAVDTNPYRRQASVVCALSDLNEREVLELDVEVANIVYRTFHTSISALGGAIAQAGTPGPSVPAGADPLGLA